MENELPAASSLSLPIFDSRDSVCPDRPEGLSSNCIADGGGAVFQPPDSFWGAQSLP
jgi:hypothetical protein